MPQRNRKIHFSFEHFKVTRENIYAKSYTGMITSMQNPILAQQSTLNTLKITWGQAHDSKQLQNYRQLCLQVGHKNIISTSSIYCSSFQHSTIHTNHHHQPNYTRTQFIINIYYTIQILEIIKHNFIIISYHPQLLQQYIYLIRYGISPFTRCLQLQSTSTNMLVIGEDEQCRLQIFQFSLNFRFLLHEIRFSP